MRSYVRESIELSNNRRLITHYTTSKFIWLSIIKFLIFLFFLMAFGTNILAHIYNCKILL